MTTASNILNLRVGLLRLAFEQIRSYSLWYIGAIIFLFLTHWIQSRLPFMVKDLADMAGSQNFSEAKVTPFIFVALGIFVFRSFSRILIFYPARVKEKDMRVGILNLLESASPMRYRSYQDGQIFQILNKDIEEVRSFLGFSFLQIGNILIALVVLTPQLMVFEPRLIFGLIPMFVAFLIFSLTIGGNHRYYKKMQDYQGEMQNFIMESYLGKKTIKNFHVENSFISLFGKNSIKDLNMFYKASARVAFSMPLLQLGMGLSLISGGYIIFQTGLEASAFVLFSGFVFLFMEPLTSLSWMGMVVIRSIGSWGRIQDFLGVLSHPSALEVDCSKQSTFLEKKLSFDLDYWGERLSIHIPLRCWSVFIGKTGHGKSYVIEQLADILKIQGAAISYVAQSPYLYNDTIEANIFLGRDVDDRMRAFAYRFLNLFELQSLASGQDSLLQLEVGENGKRLSGGQIKRLALVRSLMSDADILLWDGPFSSIDVILEKKIAEAIKQVPEFNKKTIILTSHRLTTVRKCEEVIFLEKDSGIIEKGRPCELLKGNSKTYDYFTKQMV